MSGYYPYGGAAPTPPPPPEEKGSAALRTVLIVAALAGVATVVAGMLIVLNSPAEYGLESNRDALALQSQPTGKPEQALFQAGPDVPPPLPQIVPAPAMLPSTPVRLVIKRLGINAPIKSVGLAKDGSIEVPPSNNANLAGWYRNMSTPGEAGPAVVLGHKDTRTSPAVFSKLPQLKNGDTIEVQRQDKTTAVFTVGGVEQANKKTFPTERVYGGRENAQLHLITCGGIYNRITGHYTDNVIVYATMTSSYRS
ncbi:LPXTG-site transpeptidase (sortase) family protein [Nonomuraea solani]|uniref:LPXTG-site transpeptidase (Sortase) family protein n=1 Tax=Nonomuraea solani TaxID=1144553 RepID=A0A1H6ET96_9ACTN|nr:class F sortase [Nonomuraea solani]SEH00301.1 LPXTG-site transpeptidase (sortase) family protein [Nonomuraea solani]